MSYYQEILSFHIIAVLSWMSVLFYMPRLFVYHQEHKDSKEFTDVIKIQESKIYGVIGFPAKIATILSGATLIYLNPTLLEQDWMLAKLFILLLLIIYSFSMEYFRTVLKRDACTKTGQFFRTYSHTTYKNVLFPIWTAQFSWKEKEYNYAINAQTGKIVGERPYSTFKITLLVIVILLGLGGIFYLQERYNQGDISYPSLISNTSSIRL